MKTSQLILMIQNGEFDQIFIKLYGKHRLEYQKERYINISKCFESLYGDREVNLFSVPGRSEISGNHTDHNHGKVIAASLDIDIIAVASPLRRIS